VLRIDIITIFPKLFQGWLDASLVGAARERGLIDLRLHDLREHAHDRHRSVDDAPYGGGPGMVMRPEPLVEAVEAVAGRKGPDRVAHVVLLSPQGRRLDQQRLAELARLPRLVLVCGRYEGVDQRAVELAMDEEISIGDYVLSGGEVPAMVVAEGVARLVPGVLGNAESVCTESFQAGLLEGPHYTRPPEFGGLCVPEVLRSGDHGAVERWRREKAREVTRVRRPDLLGPASREESS
jgi:tRNA (guanine37-N1)-methyltransferase